MFFWFPAKAAAVVVGGGESLPGQARPFCPRALGLGEQLALYRPQPAPGLLSMVGEEALE